MQALTLTLVLHLSIPTSTTFLYVEQLMIPNIHSGEHFFKRRESFKIGFIKVF